MHFTCIHNSGSGGFGMSMAVGDDILGSEAFRTLMLASMQARMLQMEKSVAFKDKQIGALTQEMRMLQARSAQPLSLFTAAVKKLQLHLPGVDRGQLGSSLPGNPSWPDAKCKGDRICQTGGICSYAVLDPAMRCHHAHMLAGLAVQVGETASKRCQCWTSAALIIRRAGS